MITVVNRRFTDNGYYIGRPSVLGNPFSHKHGTAAEFLVASRQEAIEKYRAWLVEQLKTNERVKREFDMLLDCCQAFGELRLSCWCKPKPCHGDVIKEMLEGRLS